MERQEDFCRTVFLCHQPHPPKQSPFDVYSMRSTPTFRQAPKNTTFQELLPVQLNSSYNTIHILTIMHCTYHRHRRILAHVDFDVSGDANFFFFLMKIVWTLIIYAKCIPRLIRSEWPLCFYNNVNKEKLSNFLTYTIFWSMQIKMWYFFLLTYLKLTQFPYTEMGNFPHGFVSLNEIRSFDTLKLATFTTIISFWMSNITFYTEIRKFSDDFMTWTREDG